MSESFFIEIFIVIEYNELAVLRQITGKSGGKR